MRIPLLLLCLLWSLVEVHSQTEYPYVSFMGETLPNHAYVNLSLVGNDDSGSDSVQCHTDLDTCCSSTEGIHRGHWFLPDNEMTLPFSSINASSDIFEAHGAQRVDLRHRNNTDMPSGIYRCDIPTVAVHNNNDTVRESVYVGLYATGPGGNQENYFLIFLLLQTLHKYADIARCHYNFLMHIIGHVAGGRQNTIMMCCTFVV